MGEVQEQVHIVGLTSYPPTSFSFPVNQPSHSWDTVFSKSDHKNPRSWSHVRCNILLIRNPFVPHHSSFPFLSMLRYSHFKICLKKSKVKVIVPGHLVGPTSYRLTSFFLHVNQFSHSWDIWPSKSKVKVMSEVKVQSLKIHGEGHGSRSHSGSNTLINSNPFYSKSIDLSIPEKWLFQNLTLQIQGQGHGWSQSSRSHGGCLLTDILFVSCQSALSFLRLGYSKFDLQNPRSRSTFKVT